MTATQTDASQILEAAGKLAFRVGAAADRIEAERRIPPEIAEELADRGFFRLLLPRSLGGSELEHPDFLKVVSLFAQADASAAWCINQNNVFSTNAVRVSKDTAREIWGIQRNVVTNGPPVPGSRADVVDGGYRLSGRWNFSSGIPHATWVAALTPVYQPGQSEPSGMRTLLLPKEQVKMVDVWQVGGLRGTGSLSFEADGVFVPASRSYPDNAVSSERGPNYVIPTTLLFCSGFATVALGAARAGLDAAIALTKSKTQHFQRERMSDLATTQRMVGQAEAKWNAARSYLGEAALSMWAGAKANLSLTVEERIAVRLSSTHAIREAAKVVDVAYALCGSSAIFASGPILRRFQDVHTITQQVQGRLSHYDTAGQYYLDTEPEGIF